MKKIAMLLAACLLLSGTVVCAEVAENAQTEATEPEIVGEEIEREVWRGEVTAIDEDSITLKIIEYNPGNPVLPGMGDEMMEFAEGEQLEEIPYEGEIDGEESAAVAEDETIDMNGESDETEENAADMSGEESEATVEIVSILIAEETVFYIAAPGETEEVELEAMEDAETPEAGEAVEYYVFEDAAFADIAVGDVLTVEIIDGVASVVVIEDGVEISDEADM